MARDVALVALVTIHDGGFDVKPLPGSGHGAGAAASLGRRLLGPGKPEDFVWVKMEGG